MKVALRALLSGKRAPLGKRGIESGIFKRPLAQAVEVTSLGLRGDEQGDRQHHGGPEKALHHYPFDHYASWRAEIPALAAHFTAPGAFGENISTEGMTEAEVCVSDIYRLGSALVQVSQARQPCWRLNERFGDTRMARRVQDSGRCGWYYRVLEEGSLGPGDSIELVERCAERWSLARISDVLYRDTLNLDSLTQLAELSVLSDSWRKLARRRLSRQAVEDWTARLDTPEAASS